HISASYCGAPAQYHTTGMERGDISTKVVRARGLPHTVSPAYSDNRPAVMRIDESIMSINIDTVPATRLVPVGPWRVTLHRPVLAYRGTREEHVTRPNLCLLRSGAIGAIFQTTFDTSATPSDSRHVCVSIDEGHTWRVVGEHLDIGSYSLFSKPDGDVVT